MAEIIKLPKKRIPKTIKQHRKWEGEDRLQLRADYEKVKGNVPKDWFKEQAKKYDRTILAIMKQLHPSSFKNYASPTAASKKSEIILKPDFRDSAMKQAQNTLKGKYKEENGAYWLYYHGKWNPAKVHDFIRAANIIRKARGEILITGCHLWEP